jgi:DNA transformation protein
MVPVTVRRHSPPPPAITRMSVSESFHTFVLDQLRRAAPRIRSKSMFGGVGVYSGELFFALIDDDVLFLKVDDTNRPDFVARGMKPFAPFGEGGEVMQYYRLPEELLEDPEELRPWVEKAIAVAARKKKKKPAKAKAAIKEEKTRNKREAGKAKSGKAKPKPGKR